jgi:hypothetical protein
VVPLLQGKSGPQLGDDSYLLSNSRDQYALIIKGFGMQSDLGKQKLLEDELEATPESVRYDVVNQHLWKELGSLYHTLSKKIYEAMTGACKDLIGNLEDPQN